MLRNWLGTIDLFAVHHTLFHNDERVKPKHLRDLSFDDVVVLVGWHVINVALKGLKSRGFSDLGDIFRAFDGGHSFGRFCVVQLVPVHFFFVLKHFHSKTVLVLQERAHLLKVFLFGLGGHLVERGETKK